MRGVNLGAGLEDGGVIVTGAGGAIGRAVARTFARAGARVLAVDVRGDALDRAMEDLGATDRHGCATTDLADLASHDRLVDLALRRFGRLDALAHVAGLLRRSPDVDAVSEADWDAQVDVNLKAAFFLNRAAARAMREQGRGGAIVNFSSQGWWTGGFGGSVVYNAAKGGIVSMSRGLARTFAPDGITVNVVAPGLVDSPMLRSGLDDDALADLVRQVPMGRMATPDEVAGAVVFLASAHARYVTGATLNVSGGWLMY